MIDIVSIPFIGSVIGGIIGNRSDDRWCDIMRHIEDKFRTDEPVNHHVHRAVRRAILLATRIEVKRQFDTLYKPNIPNTPENKEAIDAIRKLDQWLAAEISKTHDSNYIPEKSAADDQFHHLLIPGKTGSERTKELKQALQNELLRELTDQKLIEKVSITAHIMSDEWFQAVCGQFEFDIRRDPRLSDLLSNKLLAGLMVQQESGVEVSLSSEQFRSQLDEWGKPILKQLEEVEQLLLSMDSTLKTLIQSSQQAFDFLIPMAMYLPGIAANQESMRGFLESALQELHQSQQAGHQITHDYAQVILSVLQQILDRLGRSSTQPDTYNNLPPQTASFVPKQNEIDQLLQKIEQYPRVALSELGGIGKTQTALHVAHVLIDQYDYVLWLMAEDIRFAGNRLQQLVNALGIPGADPEYDTSYLEALLIWLRSESSKLWLLIVDNADDPESLREFFNQLPAQRGKVLLTSRARANQLATLNLPGDAVLEAKLMSEPEAVEFLFHRTGKDRNGTTENNAKALANRLGYLPLALEQACVCITQTGATFSDYLQSYDEKRREWDEKYKPQMGDYPKSVGTTWLVTMAHIQEQSPVSVELLRLLAFFDSDRIPLWLVQLTAQAFEEPLKSAGASDISLREALAPLQSYSLIDYDGYTEQDGELVPISCAVHGLVQEVVRDNIRSKQVPWGQTLVSQLEKIAPDPQNPAGWQTWREMLPHLTSVLTRANDLQVELLQQAVLLNLAGVFLYTQGRYVEAEPLYARALAIVEQQLGAAHPSTAMSLNNLAELYYSQGRYVEAERLYARALAIREQQLGADHPDKATSLNNLAGIYESQGRYVEAERLLKRALVIREQQLGADHPSTATSLNNLAGIYQVQGRYDEAEWLYVRALAIFDQQLGADHPSTATSLNNLAGLYKSQGRYVEAEPLLKRALAIVEQQLGEEHPDTAHSLNNLAGLYESQGRYVEAEPLLKRALAIVEQQLGRTHPHTLTVAENYAVCLQELGKTAELIELVSRFPELLAQR